MTVLDKQVAAYLEALVQEGSKTVTYSDLLQHFRLPPITDSYRWQNSPMPPIFASLDQGDMRHRQPLRTSVVVRKTKSKTRPSVPGKGYFKTLCAYRAIPIPVTIAEKREAHRQELDNLSACHGTRESGR